MGDIRLDPEMTQRCICGNTAPRDHEDCICGEPFEVGMTVKEYKALRALLLDRDKRLLAVKDALGTAHSLIELVLNNYKESGDPFADDVFSVGTAMTIMDAEEALQAALKAANVYSPAVGKEEPK